MSTPHTDLLDTVRSGADGTLAFEDVALLALGEAHPRLLRLVEVVEARVQRVIEVLHVSSGMQHLPGMRALSGFARLQDQEQRVEA